MMSFVISSVLGVIMLVSVLSLAAFHTWLERKQSAGLEEAQK